MARPITRLVAYTRLDTTGVESALQDLKAEDFNEAIEQANEYGLPEGATLCSMFAKMCYRSLVLGQNANVTKVRDIEDNLRSVIDSGHGSVLEHFWFSFVTTNCSRVFTHELVRHRVGTAFSQTSGRYVSIDELELVLPPELEDYTVLNEVLRCRDELERSLRRLREILIKPDADFATKKRLTSAIRRLAPNGQANEIAWSANWRALRHMIEMRTSVHAEWEIREVFGDVAKMLLARWPILLYGGEVNAEGEWKGLKL